MHKKKGKKGYLLFKLDFEKSYDRVDWEFLKITLSDFGFPEHIINMNYTTTNLSLWWNCTTTTSLSLKWNSEILDFFVPRRGSSVG